MAPGANILYVAGRSLRRPRPAAALNKIVDQHRADIITNSWGDIGEDVAAATLQRVPRSRSCRPRSRASASSSPRATTATTASTRRTARRSPTSRPPTRWSPPSAAPRSASARPTATCSRPAGRPGRARCPTTASAWNPAPPGDFLYGGGGGVSSAVRAAGVPTGRRAAIAIAQAAGRAVPDIAMDGDPQTGMLVGETQTFPDGSVQLRRVPHRRHEPVVAAVSRASRRSPTRRPATRTGSRTPRSTRSPASGALHDVAGPRPVPAVVRVNYNNGVDDADGHDGVAALARRRGPVDPRRPGVGQHHRRRHAERRGVRARAGTAVADRRTPLQASVLMTAVGGPEVLEPANRPGPRRRSGDRQHGSHPRHDAGLKITNP